MEYWSARQTVWIVWVSTSHPCVNMGQADMVWIVWVSRNRSHVDTRIVWVSQADPVWIVWVSKTDPV